VLNLYNYKGFMIQGNDHSPEANNISCYCLTKDISLLNISHKDSILENYVPSGSVDWCSKILGRIVKPDYFPDWCRHLLYRNVWYSDKWLFQKAFVKPADKHKRFVGFQTTGSYKKKKKPPFWYSDIVHFKDEFRYYITNGKIVFADWYWNEDNRDGEILNPPDLNLSIPSSWCGTIDMGFLDTGELALIECHPPFACGWYGGSSNTEIYMQWLIDGWKYLNNAI
jgi:hypothetical protein